MRLGVLVRWCEWLLVGGLMVMAFWAKPPWVSLGGLSLLSVGLLGAELAVSREWLWKWDILFGWGCTAVVVAGVGLARVYTLDFYHALLAWLTAAAIWLAGRRATRQAAVRQWRILGLFWAFVGSGLWLGVAYLQNLSGLFHLGVLFNVALLVLCRFWFRLPGWATQAVNTLILLLVALPAADLFFRPSYQPTDYLAPGRKLYSYAAAKGDPATFARWCHAFQAQWDKMAADVFMQDPPHVLPVRLKPGGEGRLFDSRISINHLGFRGPEIQADKGNAYRIVALGESTTFGCTLNPGEKPWPELLEAMIRERLHPDRPVQVINAGVPADHLEHSLYRLRTEILALKPDMLLSYHGFNGFCLLSDIMPNSFGEIPPAYHQRPLKLLGDCEYRLKLVLYKRRVNSRLRREPPDLASPMDTRYAAAYRQLLGLAKTNHLALALANFSMALNADSPTDVVAFYRTGFPSAYWQIRANAAHSQIVAELAREHPEVCFVDTHSGLDGVHEKFIDLVHLTQQGRQQLAENFFAGIKEMLARELASAKHAGP